jgi:hypothetical protein
MESALLQIPHFKDGDTLTEREMYALTRISIDCLRWGIVASRTYGFFSPLAPKTQTWNVVEVVGDEVHIHPLYLVSPSGYLFVVVPAGERAVWSVRVDTGSLYLRLNLASNSKDYIDGGYSVEPAWQPSGSITDPLTVELGIVEEIQGREPTRKFKLLPPAQTCHSTSAVLSAVKTLQTNIKTLESELVRHSQSNPEDRGVLMDRLERVGLTVTDAPLNEFITEVKLLLTSARGFLDRLSWSKDRNALKYKGCSGLTGRSLEIELANLAAGGNLTSKSISQALQLDVATNDGQLQFIKTAESSISAITQQLRKEGAALPLRADYPKPEAKGKLLYRWDLPTDLPGSVRLRLTRDIKDLRYAFSNVELKEVAENLKYVTDAVREADGRYRLYGVGSVLDILAPEGADPQIFIE